MNKKALLFLLPAAAGFAALFLMVFGLIASALALVSAGLLTAPLGALYCLGVIRIVSDLSAPALTALGCFCLSFGILLCLVIYRFAPFCVSLLYRYVNSLFGRRWRRMYFPPGHNRLIVISVSAAVISLAVTCILQYIAVQGGFEGTVTRDRLVFSDAKYLYISTSSLDFELKYHTGDGIVVEYVNDSPMITEESDVNYLRLVQDDSFTISLFAREQFGYRMTVWLPENDYREFYLNSGSGNITLYETLSEYTELRTRSGDITVTQAQEKLQAETIAGDIYCDYTAFVNSGSFSSKSGNINVTMPDYSGVLLVFETESGWLESGLMGLEERVYGSRSLERKAALSHSLYVSTVSGGFALEASE